MQNLADGYFVFKVYAVDIAGNIGPIAATPFRVDTGSGSDGSKKKRIIIGVVVGVGGALLLVSSDARGSWLLLVAEEPPCSQSQIRRVCKLASGLQVTGQRH